ncbi:MAG TPA: BTAD domain-containing putative transcriptional regulator [Geodermatophilus sp.]|nr:BTAD domain-containing putative transcriptional regulator [Geodermatophilus sp.]
MAAGLDAGTGAGTGSRVECRVLGPLEVTAGGWPLPLGGRKQRLLLAVLLLAAGRTVSDDRLIDVLWGEEAGDRVRNTLQVHVSALRRVLQRAGAGLEIVRREPGYAVPLQPGQLDLLRFRDGVDRGRTALREGRAAEAVAALDEALALWRGPALADLADEPALRAELTALEESRLAAVATRAEAHLAQSRHTGLIGELAGLVAATPLDEHLRALLVLALYRSGRPADALTVLREGRRVLRDELGADPGPELRDLERAVLAAEDLRGIEREERPFLVFRDAAGEQRVAVLDRARSPVTVGRGADNAVRLPWDREVSRRHATLEWCRLGWVLVDGSRNGSLVDGRPVHGRRLLRDGAVVRVGETALLFRSATRGDAPPELATVPTAEAPAALLGALDPREAAVLDAVLAVPAGGYRGGRPEELLAEALALPVAEVDAVVTALCRRLGVPDSGPARVPDLGTRARALGIGSA